MAISVSGNKLVLNPKQRQRVQLLVDALEGDRFLQGSGHLAYREFLPKANASTDDAYCGRMRHCCLGVACEIAIEHGLDVHRVSRKHWDERIEVLEYNGNAAFLPESVQQWYGFSDPNPAVAVTVILSNDGLFGQTEMVQLSALNDGDSALVEGRMLFPQIAAALRETYLENNTHDETD